MSGKRLRLALQVMLVAGALAFLVVAYLGLSALSGKSQEVVDLKLKNKKAEAQLASLAIAKKEVEQYGYFKDVTTAVIPADKDQAQAVFDITQMAKQVGINIQSITFPTSVLGSPGAAAPATGSSATSTAPANVAGASAKSVLSQARPVEGITGLYALELTITSEAGGQVPLDKKATFPKLLELLRKLENNRRTAQISQVTISPESDENNVSPYLQITLDINIFLKP